MKRWETLRTSLSDLSFRQRKELFLEFADAHDRWSKHTLEILSKVVVYLLSQVEVVEMYDIHKQALNRNVKAYKEFLYARGFK